MDKWDKYVWWTMQSSPTSGSHLFQLLTTKFLNIKRKKVISSHWFLTVYPYSLSDNNRELLVSVDANESASVNDCNSVLMWMSWVWSVCLCQDESMCSDWPLLAGMFLVLSFSCLYNASVNSPLAQGAPQPADKRVVIHWCMNNNKWLLKTLPL